MIQEENIVRQKFLFGLTLSEISFIYFIIILLLSLFYIDEYKKKTDNLEDEIRDNEATILQFELRINELEDELGIPEDEKDKGLADRLIDIKKLKDKITIYQKDKEKLDKILKEQEKLKLDNIDLIVILEKYSEIMKQLELFSTDNDSVDEKISDLLANSSKYESQKKELEKLEKDLEIIKKEVDKKGEGDRHGPPPCFFHISEKVKWKDKKKEDFMYNIGLFANYFELTPLKWKTKDQKSMEDIWKVMKKEEDISKLSNAFSKKIFRLSKDQLARFGSTIDKHAVQNNCKHYVRIFDRISNSAKTVDDLKKLKPNRLLVERYFYKYEVPLKKK